MLTPKLQFKIVFTNTSVSGISQKDGPPSTHIYSKVGSAISNDDEPDILAIH